MAGKAKESVIEKKNEVFEEIIPTFDSYRADTKSNKKRFEEFFGFSLTNDVVNLYCFSDQIGIDSKFIFSFTCNDTTKNKIVNFLKLKETKEPDNFSQGLWQPFPWWDDARITRLNPYFNKTEEGYYKYLWFDTMKKHLYYIEFDM